MTRDLFAKLELLPGDGGDAGFRRLVDDRTHLRAEYAKLACPTQELVEVRHRLHQADPVLLRLEPLIDLDDRNDAAFLPQVSRDWLALRLAVHRALKQDGGNDLVAGKGGRGDDAHAHLVHQLVHLGVVAFVVAVRNSVEPQRAGGRSAALVERGDEAGLARHLRHHLVVGHGGGPRLRYRRAPGAGLCNGAHGTPASRAANVALIAVSPQPNSPMRNLSSNG